MLNRGYEYESDSSTESGKSEFDEEYYNLAPPPILVDTNQQNITQITAGEYNDLMFDVSNQCEPRKRVEKSDETKNKKARKPNTHKNSKNTSNGNRPVLSKYEPSTSLVDYMSLKEELNRNSNVVDWTPKFNSNLQQHQISSSCAGNGLTNTTEFTSSFGITNEVTSTSTYIPLNKASTSNNENDLLASEIEKKKHQSKLETQRRQATSLVVPGKLNDNKKPETIPKLNPMVLSHYPDSKLNQTPVSKEQFLNWLRSHEITSDSSLPQNAHQINNVDKLNEASSTCKNDDLLASDVEKIKHQSKLGTQRREATSLVIPETLNGNKKSETIPKGNPIVLSCRDAHAQLTNHRLNSKYSDIQKYGPIQQQTNSDNTVHTRDVLQNRDRRNPFSYPYPTSVSCNVDHSTTLETNQSSHIPQSLPKRPQRKHENRTDPSHSKAVIVSTIIAQPSRVQPIVHEPHSRRVESTNILSEEIEEASCWTKLCCCMFGNN